MKTSSSPTRGKKLVTGVAWYRPEQWTRLVEICADGETLNQSYENWLRTANARFEELTAAGWTLKRVDVDVEELLAWCGEHGRPVDGKARSAYAAHVLEQQYKSRRAPK